MARILTKVTSSGLAQSLYPSFPKSLSWMLNRRDQGVDIFHEEKYMEKR